MPGQVTKLVPFGAFVRVEGDGVVHCADPRRRLATRSELRLAIVVWVDKTYHPDAAKTPPGRLTPIEFETLHQGLTRP